MDSNIATVKRIIGDKGFCFVDTVRGDAFCHASVMATGLLDQLKVGDKLRIVLGSDNQGRARVLQAEKF